MQQLLLLCVGFLASGIGGAGTLLLSERIQRQRQAASKSDKENKDLESHAIVGDALNTELEKFENPPRPLVRTAARTRRNLGRYGSGKRHEQSAPKDVKEPQDQPQPQSTQSRTARPVDTFINRIVEGTYHEADSSKIMNRYSYALALLKSGANAEALQMLNELFPDVSNHLRGVETWKGGMLGKKEMEELRKEEITKDILRREIAAQRAKEQQAKEQQE